VYLQSATSSPELEKLMNDLSNAIADMKATTAALKDATDKLVKVKAETVSTLQAMDALTATNATLEAKVAELQASGATLPAELLALIAESKAAATAVQAGLAAQDDLIVDIPVPG
jgi:prophage DNA circulation protein